MEARQAVEAIRAQPWYAAQIAHLEVVKGRRATFGECEPPLSEKVREWLAAKGIGRLYLHQARAIGLVMTGKHTIVATGTASGKSLCYLVPILEDALLRPQDCSLLLYPTKALAQDQLRKTRELLAHHPVRTDVYDGDTPIQQRGDIRRSSQLIFTNPDMLHLALLPNHGLWSRFFSRLRFVVLDEVHTYRGVFGSHAANLFRRLRRICAFYGSSPTFISCSATVPNPGELAAKLVGLEFEVVDEDTSPCGDKYFLLWNPRLAAPVAPARAENEGRQSAPLERAGEGVSPYTDATRLLSFLAKRGVHTIVFVRARQIAELVLRYVRQALEREGPDLADRIMSYRGGYLPEQRREIERALFDGQLMAVVATTALEVGVDMGGLEATLMTGYPGTIASVWQQAGRSGRGEEESLAVLIGMNDPLEQYILAHPRFLFGSASEKAILNPDNPYILAGHLLCAAYEKPLEDVDLEFFGERSRELVQRCMEEGYLRKLYAWHWDGEGYPAEQVHIRSIGDIYSIRLVRSGEELGTVEASTAFFEVHPGAVYLHQGQAYVVKELDLQERVAWVEKTEPNYFTEPVEESAVRILAKHQGRKVGEWKASLGEVRVRERVTGFRRRRVYNRELLDVIPLDLPPVEFETQGIWLTPQVQGIGLGRRFDLVGSLHALEHCLIGVMPLFASCDRYDLGGVSQSNHVDVGCPFIAVYDSYPGGMGLVERGFDVLPQLLETVKETIAGCPCDEGCPGCIQSSRCGSNNEPLDKRGALVLLRTMAATLLPCGEGSQ